MERMEELELIREDGKICEYLCNFMYKYAIYWDMPKCKFDVEVTVWAKALYRTNPCIQKVWKSMDEFINAYVKEERKCGDRGLATRMLAKQWGMHVYGYDQAIMWHFINQTYEELVHLKYWCNIPWSNLIVRRTKGVVTGTSLLFSLSEYDPNKEIQYSKFGYYETNGDHTQPIRTNDGQPDKWKWLELCDSGAKIER